MKSKKTTQTKINVKAKTTRSQEKDVLYLKMNSLKGKLDWDGQSKKSSEYVCNIQGNGEIYEVTNESICRLLKNEVCSDMQMDPYMSLRSKELDFEYIGPLLTSNWIQNSRPSRAQGFSQRKIGDRSNEKKETVKKLFSHSSSKGVVMIVHDPESLYHWFTVIMIRSSSRAVNFIVSDSLGKAKEPVINLTYQ